jgi:peroxiredoxin
MEQRWWETPARIMNDFWWAWLLIIVLALAAFFTRHMWLPSSAPVDRPSGLVVTAVSGAEQLMTLIPTDTEVDEPQAVPATTVPIQSPTGTPETAAQPLEATEIPTAPTTVAEVGSHAPNFSLTDLEGRRISLNDYEGQPVLLVFFASWCPHCQNEAKSMQEVAEKFRDRNLAVLAVNITFNDNESDVRSFAQQYGWDFPVLLDQTGSVLELYKQDGVPVNVFIRDSGEISDIVPGELPLSELDRLTLKLFH